MLQQAEPGLRLREPVGRVEEELGRVVAGLAVDVDAAGELGRAIVVEPVVVGEPGAGLGDDDELARALVVEAVAGLRLAVEHLVDAGQRLAARRACGFRSAGSAT